MAKFKKTLQFIATVCIGGISLGIGIAWTSPVLPKLNFSNSASGITTDEASWIGSTLAIGCLIAAIPSGFLADKFGRKTCILVLMIPVIIFTVLVLVATNVYYIYVARIFSGFTAGGVSVVAPMYIGEIADIQLRGVLGSFFEFLIYVGILITAIAGAYLPYTISTLLLGLISLGLGIGFCFFPESPTYLLMKGRRESAKKALKFYRGHDFEVNEELDVVEKELDELNRKEKVKILDVWGSREALRALIACAGLTIFQQLCAVDALTFYCVSIFETAETKMDPYTSSIVVTITQLFSSCFAICVIEKLNRKTFLYISTFGTGVMLALMGVYFHLKKHEFSSFALDLLPLCSMILFYVFFALGLGPILWLVNSELFSSEIKGIGNGITISCNWGFLFVVTKLFPIMLEKIEPYISFYIFSSFMVLCLIFIKFFVPETKGKSLQEIQAKLKL